ncbi:hypothetical protein KFE25_011761 [Diacronema lutheri]|uniref:F-box domain-containing protein n=1 Tax=Diacronema lutheri TaxID=2081491 RepID=A0A8J5XKA5_DIALT|nr:hypothetical protein KFE25_011761 [Diacronema lutheri]
MSPPRRDWLAALPDETLHSVIAEATRADVRAFGRIARCSARCARVAACAREPCAAERFAQLEPDAAALLARADGFALAARLGAASGDSWGGDASVLWVERLRRLHAERALVASAGVSRVWAGMKLPCDHVLRLSIARALLGGADRGVQPQGALLRMAVLIGDHVQNCEAHGLPAPCLVEQLSRTHPFETTGGVGLPLALLLAERAHLPCHAAAASFLLDVVSREDVERAYLNLLTVQRPLLSAPELARLDGEFRATFDAALKYGLENH